MRFAGGGKACKAPLKISPLSWLLDMVPGHEVMQFSIRQVPYLAFVSTVLEEDLVLAVHVLSMQQSCQTNWTEVQVFTTKLLPVPSEMLAKQL